MYVKKRNNNNEIVSFDKILKRVKILGNECDPPLNINYTTLVMKIIEQLYNNISTSVIDELTAQQCATMCTVHPDYTKLAGILVISNLHKKTNSNFVEVMNNIYNFKDINNIHQPYLNDQFISIVNNNSDYFNNLIQHNRDYFFDYFGFKTLEKSYLIKLNSIIVERPQYMWLRVAISIHKNNLELVKETYDLLSNKYFTHATPTLYNSGTQREQLSSCYLLGMEDDSIDGIFNTLKDCASISKWAGGIGLHINNIRGKGSHIRGTNGVSNGIIPMLRVYNNTARYVDQGGGKRNGSFAIYLEPHHIDIEDFLELRKNHGDEELKARDLFYALWISDLFMECVHNNKKWYLFCPDSAPGLCNCYGEEYKNLYNSYVEKKIYKKEMNARDLWIKILDSQMETGTPYILYKDSANKKSNQKNLGTIQSSNLCTEIIEYSDSKETAVCNLASIALNKLVIETESPFSDNVVVYTKNNCNWCIMLKLLLKRKNITYKEIILNDNNIKEKLKELNVNTLPQLLDDNNLIGGFDNVMMLLRNKYDYKKLYEITQVITNNLNNIIDNNYYPTEKTKRSNLFHRPIGIGVQGLADTFILMDYPYCSDEAKEINKNIFETIYYAALEKSLEISKNRNNDILYLIEQYELGNWSFKTSQDICTEYSIHNKTESSIKNAIHEDNYLEKILLKIKPIKREIVTDKNRNLLGSYSSFVGSPASQGILQFDMWNCTPSENYNWKLLKHNITTYGLRNSLLVAPMPTASTSQILGNNECFEPLTSNIYSRRTLAGEFILVNKYLINELISLNIWNENIKNNIIVNKGSVQNIDIIPKFLKDKYKIVWEMSMKDLIDMSRDRGAYICQSQSLNLWIEDPDHKKLTNMHFYSWKSGLKTGIYYLRRKAKHQAQQFTIEPVNKNKNNENNENV